MGFAGNLRTFPLSEVVQTINRIGGTGVLRLVSGEVSREVIFQLGNVVGVAFPQGQERQALLSRLVMQGHIDATDAASMSSGSSPSQVIAALIDNQLVTEDEVTDAAKAQAEEELYDIFTWESADFTFSDASAPAAGEHGTETYTKVNRHAANRLKVNINSALMEAARRADDWSRLKTSLPDPAAVPGPAENQETALAAAGADFPAAAVIPLIDAIRSIDEIVSAAVVTRLDVYAVLAQLSEAKVLVWLNRADLVSHGDWQASQGAHNHAAALYRKALAQDGHDHDTRHKLAASLEQVGDAIEGAASYAQLAIAALDGGDLRNAQPLAQRAVNLAPNDVRWRCLFAKVLAAVGDKVGAISEFVLLAAQHENAGRFEDGRGAAREALMLQPTEQRAIRVLARIAIATAGEARTDGKRPCPACLQLNAGEATVCTACRLPLQIPCKACANTVLVFDSVCSVCAADPHADASTLLTTRPERSGLTRPASSIIDAVQAVAAVSGISPAITTGSGSGVQKWREDLDVGLAKAKACEDSGNWDAALVAWRAVATLQPDSPALISHIKEIEGRLHELTIERGIERGHQMRRARHYFRAVSEYRAALRLMGGTDPRAKPVGEALRRAEKDRIRATSIFAMAGVLVLATGVFALRPYVMQHRFNNQIALVRDDVTQLAAAEQIADLNASLDTLAERATAMPGAFGRQANQRLDELVAEFNQAQSALSITSMKRIRAALVARDAPTAQAAIATHLAFFRPDFQGPIFVKLQDDLMALKTALKIRDDANLAAPGQLAAAIKLEEEHRLGEALALYRTLPNVSQAEVAATANEAIKRLTPQETSFLTAWDSTISAVAAHLDRAPELEALIPNARLWGREAELKRLRDDAGARLAAATAAWRALEGSNDPSALEAFLAAHPGAPQTAQAQTRRTALAGRLQTRDQAVATQRGHLTAGRWQEAWQSGQDLLTSYKGLVDPTAVELPLLINSSPLGATVNRDGKALGVTPFVVRYRTGETAQLQLTASGWEAATVTLPNAANDWQFRSVLTRAPMWNVVLGRPSAVLVNSADGILAVGHDGVAMVADGRIRWRATLPADEFGSGNRPGHPTTIANDGVVAVALPSGGAALFGDDGAARGRFVVKGDLRGRPLAYLNELLSPMPRYAVAANELRCGTPGAELLSIPLPSPAIAGPLAFVRELDRLLVVADVDGRLTAIEESTRRVAWRLDLQASDCGELVVGDAQTVLMVLDGIKLSACSVEAAPALRWTLRLPTAAVGEPVVSGNLVQIAAGPAIIRVDITGAALPVVNLPAPAATGVAVAGTLAVVGCADGTLVVMRDGVIAWTTPLGTAPLAVGICKGLIVASLGDGTLRAFAP